MKDASVKGRAAFGRAAGSGGSNGGNKALDPRTPEAPKPDIATKAERDRLIADRDNDPPTPAHNHPKPNWAVDPDHAKRMHMRKREHRINHLEKRLDKANQTLRLGKGQAFEHS